MCEKLYVYVFNILDVFKVNVFFIQIYIHIFFYVFTMYNFFVLYSFCFL